MENKTASNYNDLPLKAPKLKGILLILFLVLLDQGKGEGRSFDWSIVRENRDKLQRPFFLAGGLDAGNLAEAVELMHPWAVDMSSSLETDKVKDREKIDEIMKIMDELQKQGEE